MVAELMKYNPAFLPDEVLIRSFVARTSELERILEVLRENTAEANQHLLVIGPRGIGKTTLVLRTAAEIRVDPMLGERWYPIVFGEETYQVSSPGELWLEALFHLGEQTGESRWRGAYEELRRERDEERLRQRALAQLMDFADEQGKRLVLVVENLNMLFQGQLGSEDAWVLRQPLMNEPRLMLLATATSRFREIDEYNQALYELFRIIELEPLAEGEAQALWTAATGQEAPRHQMRPLQILTGGNPRLLRILSEFAARTSFRSLMDELTRLVDEHTEYFKHHLDSLAPQERKVFVVLADLWDPVTARQVAEEARLDVNVASAQLKRLVERGAVTSPYKRGRAQYYQVAERMYNVYHLMRRRGPSASRVHAAVRFMVSLYRDEELVRTTRSLAEEAARLTSDQRREHFLAYEAILTHTRESQLAKRLIDETRKAFESMPDVPLSVLRLIDPAMVLRQDNLARISGPDTSSEIDLDIEEVDDIPTLFRIGDYFASQPSRTNNAEAAYRRILCLAPDSPAAWWRIGALQFSNEQYDEALDSFGRTLGMDAENAFVWTIRGRALLELGRVEEALESCDRAVAVDAEYGYAWTERGNTLAQLGRVEDALESFDRAIAVDAGDTYAWTKRGNILTQLGRVEDALESFDRAIAVDAGDTYVWTKRGITLRELGRMAEALECLDRAVFLSPDEAVVWLERGFILDDLGRVTEALKSFERAISVNPEDALAWTWHGIALDDVGRLEEALESFNRAVSVDSSDAFAWANKGYALQELGRVEEALESFGRSVSLDPDDDFVWGGRGSVLVELGRLEEALESFDRMLALDARSALGWHNRGMVLLDLGRTEEAMQSFDRELALRLNANADDEDGKSDALNEMAWAIFKKGLGEKLPHAENWAQLAVEEAPESGAARHTLACILGAQHRWEEALAEASRFLGDRELLASDLDNVLDFFIDAVASGQSAEVLRVITTAGAEDALEPLVVAIRRLASEEVDVAREILEISSDVIKRIEARRLELQGG